MSTEVINDKNQNDDPPSEQKEEEAVITEEDITNIFKDEDNDDLDDTSFNNDWLINKSIIDYTYRTQGISQGLVNYGKNLILFYEKKIKTVRGLMTRKQSDNKKNFIGDVTIQEDQKTHIANMILNDSKVKNIPKQTLEIMINKYYQQIGNKSGDIMQKDYEDRNRTIKYLLLIKEYEENIEKIMDAIEGFNPDNTSNDLLFKTFN